MQEVGPFEDEWQERRGSSCSRWNPKDAQVKVEIVKCDSSIWIIWIMFTKHLEYLDLIGELGVHGACDKGTDLLRDESIIR